MPWQIRKEDTLRWRRSSGWACDRFTSWDTLLRYTNHLSLSSIRRTIFHRDPRTRKTADALSRAPVNPGSDPEQLEQETEFYTAMVVKTLPDIASKKTLPARRHCQQGHCQQVQRGSKSSKIEIKAYCLTHWPEKIIPYWEVYPWWSVASQSSASGRDPDSGECNWLPYYLY